MSSLAQEESRSISLNVTWGQRKRFADGKATVLFGRFLGYDRGEHGELVINEEEADTVRIFYAEFLAGLSYTAIAKKLTELGIKSPAGNSSAVSHVITTHTKTKNSSAGWYLHRAGSLKQTTV